MTSSLQSLCFVAAGGALGAVSRYLISQITASDHLFPWPTFIANLIGAFLIGIFYVALVDKPVFSIEISSQLRHLLIVGFLGALTTYSSFSLEAFNLFNNGHTLVAILYSAGTFAACLALTSLTIFVARNLL